MRSRSCVVQVYNLCLTLMEANTREEREGALVERVNAEVQAAGSEDRPLRAGTTAQQGAGLPGDALDTHMEVDEGENPFLNDNAGVAPSFLPETPQRVQQVGSYPTPPSTVLPLARQLPSAPVVQGTPSGTATGEAAVQGQRNDDMLDHAATTAATTESCEEHCTQIATLSAENSALAGERDFYQKKHFVTAVALKGSQLQVEKLDKEGAGLFGNIVHSLGLSRWAPQRW
ncbi:hypothetical protein BC628DRAFT_1089991 [Trametes gibbosa]|nr:hypothetical protein BC628DRAFT_1089991 [Trametes gibbosa]